MLSQITRLLPDYWAGQPPMFYGTHAIAPPLALAGCRAVKAHCLGSGTMPVETHKQYGNSYPVQTALFRLEKKHLAMEINRTPVYPTNS